MPLVKEQRLPYETKLYLWKITEDLQALNSSVALTENSKNRIANMKSESHKKGYLAVRKILEYLGYEDKDLLYDTTGKPNLVDGSFISISHSFDFSLVIISKKNIGADIEQIKPKVLKIAPRFMDVKHLEGISDDQKMKKATIVWGIKEAVFKNENKKGISFPKHIFESDFSCDDKQTTAILAIENKEIHFEIFFDSIENYIYVCSFKKSIS